MYTHRDIERRKSQDEHAQIPQHDYYFQVLWFCVFVIVVSCFIYLRSTWQTAAALRRVPTMSYYMVDEDLSLSSVHIHKSRSYSQLSRGLYSSWPA